MKLRRLWLALAVVSLMPVYAGAEEKRIALVIGNSAYKAIPALNNPKNDAVLIAKTLKTLGFTLVGDEAQLNLDKNALDRVVQTFGRQAQGADIALFYYAGHGVQVQGINYLVPVDANPTREADVDFQMLDTNLVLRQMQAAGTRLNLVILDACRNNPFGGRGLRGGTPGLAQMRAPEGTLISYATQPGNVAQDGIGDDSPYSQALATTIRRPGLEIFQTFNEVGLAVKKSTGNEQQPWTSSSPINGSFYFSGAATDPRAQADGTTARQAGTQAPRASDCAAIEAMLTHVANSKGEKNEVLPPPAGIKPSWELMNGVTALGYANDRRCTSEIIPGTRRLTLACGLAPAETVPPGADIHSASFKVVNPTEAQTRAVETALFATFERCLGKPDMHSRPNEDGIRRSARWDLTREAHGDSIDLTVEIATFDNRATPMPWSGMFTVDRELDR
jgi:caspase domain-containing protein